MDPFDTFSIPPHFLLDLTELEKRYRDLSRTLHPDKYVGRPAGERRMALSRAIEVNEAWRMLKDPAKRAEALFRRAGVVADQPAPDPDLLMEMMDLREELSAARENKDRPALDRLTSAMKERESKILARLAIALESPDANALPVLGELRYVRRVLEEASAAEDELL
jgi:molecular chaperone HscB